MILIFARKFKCVQFQKLDKIELLIFGAKIQIFYELNNLKLDQITRFACKN